MSATAAAPKVAAKKVGAKKSKFVLDLAVPVTDKLLTTKDVVAYLTEKVKVDGKAGALAGKVDIKADGSKIVVESTVQFAKRYFKYLLRKYLKKNDLRDYLRVLSSGKNAYTVRYFKTAGGDEEDEE